LVRPLPSGSVSLRAPCAALDCFYEAALHGALVESGQHDRLSAARLAAHDLDVLARQRQQLGEELDESRVGAPTTA
jgi:hypothetical protein